MSSGDEDHEGSAPEEGKVQHTKRPCQLCWKESTNVKGSDRSDFCSHCRWSSSLDSIHCKHCNTIVPGPESAEMFSDKLMCPGCSKVLSAPVFGARPNPKTPDPHAFHRAYGYAALGLATNIIEHFNIKPRHLLLGYMATIYMSLFEMVEHSRWNRLVRPQLLKKGGAESLVAKPHYVPPWLDDLIHPQSLHFKPTLSASLVFVAAIQARQALLLSDLYRYLRDFAPKHQSEPFGGDFLKLSSIRYTLRNFQTLAPLVCSCVGIADLPPLNMEPILQQICTDIGLPSGVHNVMKNYLNLIPPTTKEHILLYTLKQCTLDPYPGLTEQVSCYVLHFLRLVYTLDGSVARTSRVKYLNFIMPSFNEIVRNLKNLSVNKGSSLADREEDLQLLERLEKRITPNNREIPQREIIGKVQSVIQGLADEGRSEDSQQHHETRVVEFDVGNNMLMSLPKRLDDNFEDHILLIHAFADFMGSEAQKLHVALYRFEAAVCALSPDKE